MSWPRNNPKYNCSVDPEARKQVLERDNYECQLGKLFGIGHLSGVPCTTELEAHHLTYERYGAEIPEDLITVCSRCHDILTGYVRGLRFGLRASYDIEPEQESGRGVRHQKETKGEQPYVSDHRDSATHFAQQPIGRSPRFLHKADQSYIGQAEEDSR